MSSPKARLDELRIERSSATPGRSRLWLLMAGAAALLAISAIIWRQSRAGEFEVRTAIARDAAAGSGEKTVLNASGYVTARRQATVSSKVTGKVVEVLFEEGMQVKEGQVLARLDDSNVKTSWDVAEAEFASAKAALGETRALLKQSELELQRTSELARRQIASQSDLDNAQANFDSLKARLAKQTTDIAVAQRQIALWRQQMDDMIVRAPFDGVVTTKDAQPGEMISPVSAGGGFTRTGIGTIVDMKSLEIEIDVNESYINRVEPGQRVEARLDAYPDWAIPCKVAAIIPAADRQKATVKVRVAFDKLDRRILPDMAVKVAFQNAAGSAAASRGVAVPKSAVQAREGRDMVFVLRDGVAERRAVTVSETQNDQAILVAGLAAGERVVLDPPSNLKDGAKVASKP